VQGEAHFPSTSSKPASATTRRPITKMDFPASQEASSALPPPPEVPSVFEDSPLLRSHTYQSPIPADCLPSGGSAFAQVLKGRPCALGVDEAGRGPVLGEPSSRQVLTEIMLLTRYAFCLGPLVYGVAVCPVDAQDQLKEIGFAGEEDFDLAVWHWKPDSVHYSITRQTRRLSPRRGAMPCSKH
jgi:ribonuclease H2 subunit A